MVFRISPRPSFIGSLTLVDSTFSLHATNPELLTYQEQFHPEWDYINSLPVKEKSFTPEVAGQFSWKTNLYWIAQAMWCFITLHKPSRMPYPYWIKENRPPQYRRGKSQSDKGLHGEEGFWSWGGLVNHDRYSHIDYDLRNAIVLCMADKPAHRPEAKQLFDLIQKKTQEDWDGISKTEAYRWAAKFWEMPGVPGPRPARPPNVFEVPEESEPLQNVPPAAKPAARTPWNIAGFAGAAAAPKQKDFQVQIPGQWPKLTKILSVQQAQQQQMPAFAAKIPKALNVPQPAPKPQGAAAAAPSPQPAPDTPGHGAFGRQPIRRNIWGVRGGRIEKAKPEKEGKLPAALKELDKPVPAPPEQVRGWLQTMRENLARAAAKATEAKAARRAEEKLAEDEDMESTVRPAVPAVEAAATPAAAAGGQSRRLTPKERIQAALGATANEPAPPPIEIKLPPPKNAPTNAVAGKVRAFVVPSDSTADSDSNPTVTPATPSPAAANPTPAAAAAAAVADSMARAAARAAKSGAGSIKPGNKRLAALAGKGANILTGPQTKSGAIIGTPEHPLRPHKQVKFKTPGPLVQSSVVPFLPQEFARFQANKNQKQLIANLERAAPLDSPAGRLGGYRKVGGVWQPYAQPGRKQQKQPGQPLQENRPLAQQVQQPQQAHVMQHAQALQQQEQQPQQPPYVLPQQQAQPLFPQYRGPLQQPQQQALGGQQQPEQKPVMDLPAAFMLGPNAPRGGSALMAAKPPGPPTPLVRRITPLGQANPNRKLGGQYALGGAAQKQQQRKGNILKKPGPTRLNQVWTPPDEGGKAGRAKSGLFAGLRIRRDLVVPGQAGKAGAQGAAGAQGGAAAPAAIQEEPAEQERAAEQPLPVSEEPEPMSTIARGIANNGMLLVAHQPREPSPPPSPRELARQRAAFERFQKYLRLDGGSVMGLEPGEEFDVEESSDEDEDFEMGSTANERLEGADADPMVMSDKPRRSVSRLGSFFRRFSLGSRKRDA